ncbi:MAG TPA: ABC transporter ATP-binding protein [Candidatus Baltobacteraceae bacterium]|jgi:ABC-type nitrate/sulfonate/bicarbonate transport system ATPase subunit|nr:ABC transporter ATP-binding protein [Candidatus Baltobacteraceae bacterium]
MQSSVVFQNVSKVYDEQGFPYTALDGINLEVASEEILCLVGPSGCGKTSLLNMAAGFDSPSEGRILVAGKEVKRPHSDCGVAFQADAVFPWMTVAKNVGFGLRWNRTPPADRESIIRHYLRLVDLEAFEDRWPRELSGGMRKRVDLARVFAGAAPILLLDEPFGSLDVLTKADMQRVLLDVWRADRKTILFITHDIEEAIFLGHRVVVLSKSPGRVLRTFTVPFSLDERQEQLKLEPRFIALRRAIIDVLAAGDGSPSISEIS